MSDQRRSGHRDRYADADSGDRGGASGRRDPDGSDFQDSVARLQRAVDELVRTARTRFADHATSLIDDATQRLQRDLGRGDARPRSRAAADEPLEPLPRRLYLDPTRARIVGVCAGIARYYSAEPWVVRCVAITGLIFFPTLVFPAYWIAYIIMEKPPTLDDEPAAGRRRRRRFRRASGNPDAADRWSDASPAPELGPRLSPRKSLRHVKADLTEVELRLRRMETHVTSGRYELQRELSRIDGGA